MKLGKKFIKATITALLVFSCLAANAASGTVHAAIDSIDTSKTYNGRYLMDDWNSIKFANRCQESKMTWGEVRKKTGLKQVASAFLVGTDDIVAPSWYKDKYKVCDMYAVDPDAEIQGKKINSKYLPQDNGSYLLTIVTYHLTSWPFKSSKIYTAPEGWQGTIREGSPLTVVAYDEEWVTFYDDGFQLWNVELGKDGYVGLACANKRSDSYAESHVAGFYKVRRDEVWIDFGRYDNHPYKTEAEIPKKGTGTVTKLANLRPVPDESETVYTPVYALPKGTEVNVVSTELVPSKAAGSTHKYYKVSFNASDKVQNNATLYMKYKVPGMYYIDSRYLNFAQNGESRPEGMTLGEIKSGSTVYAYSANDSGSERIGIFTKGTQFDMLPAESGSAWTAIWFSGQKAYVQTKYVKKSSYKVTDISKLELADIVKNEFVFRWNPGKNNADFTVTLSTSKDTGAKANRTKKVALQEKHYKEATFTVDKKYMIDGGSMYITIQANTKNGKKGKMILKKYLKFPGSGKYVFKSYTAGRTEIYFKPNGRPVSLQYSTNKNFKSAKLVEKGKDKYGNYIHIDSAKKLKPNTTYYMRCRGITSYPTANGTKWMTGDWSETAKIKTKK